MLITHLHKMQLFHCYFWQAQTSTSPFLHTFKITHLHFSFSHLCFPGALNVRGSKDYLGYPAAPVPEDYTGTLLPRASKRSCMWS